MPDSKLCVPTEGRLVRDLAGRRIPEQGMVVDRSVNPSYWIGLERRGDVSFHPVPEAPAAAVSEESES